MPDQTIARRAVELAVQNVRDGGKPFACLVVDAGNGTVLVEATNQVAQTGDCTAHAEITAIRELAAKGRSDLTGCEVYVTAYPCPMCLGALYYAQPDNLVYAATREQEGAFYEDGNRYMSLDSFYAEYALEVSDRSLPAEQAVVDDPQASFKAWAQEHPDD